MGILAYWVYLPTILLFYTEQIISSESTSLSFFVVQFQLFYQKTDLTRAGELHSFCCWPLRCCCVVCVNKTYTLSMVQLNPIQYLTVFALKWSSIYNNERLMNLFIWDQSNIVLNIYNSFVCCKNMLNERNKHNNYLLTHLTNFAR